MRAFSLVVSIAALTASTLISPTTLAAGVNAAHEMAQKFSEASANSTASKAADVAKDKAVSEADVARKKAAAAKKKAEAARAAAKKREQETARLRKADEADMLVRANAEALQREAEQKRAEDEVIRAEAAAADKTAEAEKAALALTVEEQRVRDAKEQADEAEAKRRVAVKRQDEENAKQREVEMAVAAERAKVAADEKAGAEEKARGAALIGELERAAVEKQRVAEAKKAEDNNQKALAEKVEREKTAIAETAKNVAAEVARKADDLAQRELETAADRVENERKAALEAKREDETLRLSERLKEARRQKAAELEASEGAAKMAAEKREKDLAEQRARETAAHDAKTELEKRERQVAEHAVKSGTATRASVLLIMEPGNYGIRRFNKTQGDPVLCVGEVCYISQGPDAAAKVMSRFAALGAGNTLGGRSGACRLQLSCVFRNVDLGTGRVEIMPVDLHVLRHDRREITKAMADSSCVATDGRLVCAEPLTAKTYRAWVVPEPVAADAGGEVLSAALAANLDGGRASTGK